MRTLTLVADVKILMVAMTFLALLAILLVPDGWILDSGLFPLPAF